MYFKRSTHSLPLEPSIITARNRCLYRTKWQLRKGVHIRAKDKLDSERVLLLIEL